MFIQDGVHHLAAFAAKLFIFNMDFFIGTGFSAMVTKSFIVSKGLKCWHSVSVIKGNNRFAKFGAG